RPDAGAPPRLRSRYRDAERATDHAVHAVALLAGAAGALAMVARILIVAGGVLYSVGAGFYIWKSLPFQNAIWHGFVSLAAGCHYAAIWQAVVLAGTSA